MAIPTLTDEQIRTWTREQKDRWWLENVFRGDMPQLTLRAGLTGFCLGGILSATNLYVGAMSGWTLGVGITSVILAFAMFKVLSRMGAKDMTILENNAMQSTATAAGYMTGPLISGMAAYMWVENKVMPWWQMLLFNIVLSILGVLVAFPMKRKFINDEQQPFPEGRACGVVLDTLYTSSAAVGLFKAKALATAAAIAGIVTFLAGTAYLKFLHGVVLMARHGQGWSDVCTNFKDRLKGTWHLPHYLDEWYYAMAARGVVPIPRLAGVDVRQLALRPALDLALFGAGGLMGIRAATSMLIGMIVNFVFIVPWMISIGEIKPSRIAENGERIFGRVHVLNTWALWWGIVIMVTASLVALFARPKIFVEAFKAIGAKALGDKKDAKSDVLAHIELPLKVSWIGIPIVGALGVWMAYDWFGVPVIYGATAIVLIIFLTLIAASSTALTGITPVGALSKIPQFLYGGLNPTHPPTNLMTACMTTEAASNASNLLMDIKPGYMLGAKPRQQAMAHCIGIFAGALASTPLFYFLFLSDYKPGDNVQQTMAPEGGKFAFPGTFQWKGVSDLVTSIFAPGGSGSLLTNSIITSMVIAAFVGLTFEVLRIFSKGKFPISALAIGLGVVVPPESTIAMFAGAFFFWLMHRLNQNRSERSFGRRLWVDTQEPLCAGIIAGAALIGIGDVLLDNFVIPKPIK